MKAFVLLQFLEDQNELSCDIHIILCKWVRNTCEQMNSKCLLQKYRHSEFLLMAAGCKRKIIRLTQSDLQWHPWIILIFS